MLKKYFSKEVGITKKDFFTAFILLFNVLTWYLMTFTMIDSVLSGLNLADAQIMVIWAIHYIALIGSGILGSIISNKIDTLHFLYFWMFLGGAASLLPALLPTITATHVLIISFVFGVSFGLGMPSCFAYFAECTIFENRGRIAGVMFLVINLSAPFFMILLAMSSLTTSSIISAIWRGVGMILFFLSKPQEKITIETGRRVSLASVLRDRPFSLYFTAWLMFCLIDRFEQPILRNFFGYDFYNFMFMMEPIIASFSALVGGALSDLIGRKRVVIYGFVALGLAYAIMGVAPTGLISWYFYLVVDGIAAGILWVIFVLILWGDLSQAGVREKYYAIGSIPLFLSSIIPLIFSPYVLLIPAYAAFSLASLFLFLAVLPLLYAPETLPEKKIKLRRLRKYLEKAKEVKEKYV